MERHIGKTVPTIVLLIAKHRMAISSRDDRILLIESFQKFHESIFEVAFA
jgi:hypothetical protein